MTKLSEVISFALILLVLISTIALFWAMVEMPHLVQVGVKVWLVATVSSLSTVAYLARERD